LAVFPCGLFSLGPTRICGFPIFWAIKCPPFCEKVFVQQLLFVVSPLSPLAGSVLLQVSPPLVIAFGVEIFKPFPFFCSIHRVCFDPQSVVVGGVRVLRCSSFSLVLLRGFLHPLLWVLFFAHGSFAHCRVGSFWLAFGWLPLTFL